MREIKDARESDISNSCTVTYGSLQDNAKMIKTERIAVEPRSGLLLVGRARLCQA